MIFLYFPDLIKFDPVSNPKIYPEQAALKSKPQAFFAFIFFCTIAAVDGV